MAAGDPPLSLAALDAISVARLNSVNAKVGAAFEEMEIRTVLDLLQHYPRRYLDRTRQARIADLTEEEEATVEGEVLTGSTRRTRGGRALTDIVLGDATGNLKLSFFNQTWRERQLSPGTLVAVHGRVTRFRGLQMTNPVVDLVGDRTRRIVPVYPESDKAGLRSWEIEQRVSEALRRCEPRGIADPVPGTLLRSHRLVDRSTALRWIHAPETVAHSQKARRRLVFDELLRVQLELVRRKRAVEMSSKSPSHIVDAELVGRFFSKLPFSLTDAQRRAIAEIRGDLEKPYPMHRLLQGDVGAGKTVVALSALLIAVQGGFQGALMAPTEVLAEQHLTTIRMLLGDLSVPDDRVLGGERPLRVEPLTGAMAVRERRRIVAGLATGDVDITVGTHALISEGLEYRALGAVVIDEQHRFGVQQRAVLRDKGPGEVTPDLLVMTATPIPRTAAMTVYGDLDVSVLDQLPAGRLPVATTWARSAMQEAAMWQAVRDAVAAGRQAYVVCAIIDESEAFDARSVLETYARLTEPGGELDGMRVGLLHGRVTPAEKEATMELFRSGALGVLVATTVIEVGVDVPNATVMVILDADRFGIAQLHQLRGRVGRAEHASSCYLVSSAQTAEAEARLEAVESSNDGFRLAEADLELRGEGTLMGERQTGRNDLRLASLRRDKAWVQKARDAAIEIIASDPRLEAHRGLCDELDFVLGDDEAGFLLKG